MNVTPPVTSGNYAIMERPRGAGNTDRGLTRQIAPTRSEGSVEPNPNPCAGFDCERYKRGRLIRGMCPSHYNAWLATSTTKRKIPPRPKAVGCTIKGCDVQLIQARGWCAKHYTRWQKHGDPEWEPLGPRQGCDADDCERDHYSLGYCVMHYSRVRNHGTPYSPAQYISGETCEAPDCVAEAPRGRYCSAHQARLTRLGTFDLPIRDRYQSGVGYWWIKRPDHPLATSRGWIREHRVVLFDAIGPGEHPCHWCQTRVTWDETYPFSKAGLVVDHLDEDPANNNPGNLVPSCAPCNLARSSRWKKRSQESA